MGATVAELRHEDAELMSGVNGGQRIRARRYAIARHDRDEVGLGAGNSGADCAGTGVAGNGAFNAHQSGDLVRDSNQIRIGNRRRRQPRIERCRKAREAVVPEQMVKGARRRRSVTWPARDAIGALGVDNGSGWQGRVQTHAPGDSQLRSLATARGDNVDRQLVPFYGADLTIEAINSRCRLLSGTFPGEERRTRLITIRHEETFMLQGLMMQTPLAIASLIEHADRHHGRVEIVSRRVEGDLHRTTYRDLHRRARQMANVLSGMGIRQGERVATLAWNGYRHMELYFAVSGHGAVLHTINPRLHPEQIAWIANHAEDQTLFFDLTFLPIIEAIAPMCRTIKHFVAMVDKQKMPTGAKTNLLCYEDLANSNSDHFEWPEFDENQASSLCYTSGTTGNPKGVLYSHRSTLLHTFAIALPDALNCSARDTILPVVPMFHVNAWGLPYAACMMGAKLVFPGAGLDGKSLYELFETERVTMSAGVPTVWQGLLGYVEANGLKFSTMRRTVIGGSACPPAMMRAFQEQYDVQVIHAWGMTEMSP